MFYCRSTGYKLFFKSILKFCSLLLELCSDRPLIHFKNPGDQSIHAVADFFTLNSVDDFRPYYSHKLLVGHACSYLTVFFLIPFTVVLSQYFVIVKHFMTSVCDRCHVNKLCSLTTLLCFAVTTHFKKHHSLTSIRWVCQIFDMYVIHF